jgi:hypothetical protein
MRRLLSITLFFLLCLPTLAAQAQTAPKLSDLQIEFWPEYDQPSMLVIYHGTLSSDTPLPATLTFRYPAKFGKPNAVAYLKLPSDAQYTVLDYTTATAGDDLVVTFAPPTNKFRIEYYDTSLDLSTAARRYHFQSTLEYAVQSFILKVQHPLTASGLTTTPTLSETQTGDDGLTYSGLTRANVPAGDALALDLTYTKSNSDLTVGNTNTVPAVIATPTPTTPQPDALLIGIIIAGVAGAGFIGWGVWSYFRPMDGTSRARRVPRSRSHSGGMAEDAPTSTGESVFCHKCGTRSQPDDEFCRSCGARLRREG